MPSPPWRATLGGRLTLTASAIGLFGAAAVGLGGPPASSAVIPLIVLTVITLSILGVGFTLIDDAQRAFLLALALPFLAFVYGGAMLGVAAPHPIFVAVAALGGLAAVVSMGRGVGASPAAPPQRYGDDSREPQIATVS